MADEEDKTYPPPPPPMPGTIPAVTGASQNAPTSPPSVQRIADESIPASRRGSATGPIQGESNAPGTPAIPSQRTLFGGAGTHRGSFVSIRRDSGTSVGTRRNSAEMVPQSPSPTGQISNPIPTSPVSSGPVTGGTEVAFTGPVVNLPAPKGLKKKKEKQAKKAPAPKKVKVPTPEKESDKGTKVLNANYSILISGTESDSEASSIDSDALLKAKELTESELAVFDSVAAGSLISVKELLNSTPFDFNRKNIVGYTVLHISIRRQDEEMVKLIFEESRGKLWPSVLRDALLHAIKEVNPDLVRTVVNEMDARRVTFNPAKIQKRKRVSDDYLTNRKSIDEEQEYINSEFSEDMTPILLSALCDSYELVEFFYDRHHQIEALHKDDCNCSYCEHVGRLRKSLRVLHHYQAITKPGFMCYKANAALRNPSQRDGTGEHDIIYLIFLNIIKVRELAVKDVFKQEYEQIALDLEDFASSLIQQCRKTEEVEKILTQRTGYDQASPFPRLSMAIDMELKNFVSHRHCQQILYRYWAGKDWPEWRGKSIIVLILIFLIRLPTWPFIALWTCADRTSSWGKMLSCPASACLNHVAAYLFFLACLLLVDVWNPDGPDYNNIPRTGVEFVILAFVVGHIFSTMRQLAIRFHSYSASKWALYDIVTNVFFVVAYGTWPFAKMNNEPPTDRKHWVPVHSSLIAESCFTVASILAVVRLLRVLQLNTLFGPLLIAVGKMGYDILKAVIFFVVINFAFALGLYRLYRPYAGWEDVDPVTKKEVSQSETFTSLKNAYETLFWSIFSLQDASDTDIISRTITSPLNASVTSSVSIDVVQSFGKFIYCAYHVVVSLILLNLLLGMMAGTYDAVTGDAAAEWKFARSQVWLAYGMDFVSPSPLNIIPTVGLCNAREGTQKYKPEPDEKKKKQKKEKGDKNQDDDKPKVKLDVEYTKLMQSLIQRYFRDKAETATHEPATMESIEALQEDIAEFKSLLEQTETEQYEKRKNSIPSNQTPMKFLRPVAPYAPSTIFTETSEEESQPQETQNSPTTIRSRFPIPSPTPSRTPLVPPLPQTPGGPSGGKPDSGSRNVSFSEAEDGSPNGVPGLNRSPSND